MKISSIQHFFNFAVIVLSRPINSTLRVIFCQLRSSYYSIFKSLRIDHLIRFFQLIISFLFELLEQELVTIISKIIALADLFFFFLAERLISLWFVRQHIRRDQRFEQSQAIVQIELLIRSLFVIILDFLFWLGEHAFHDLRYIFVEAFFFQDDFSFDLVLIYGEKLFC